MALSEFTRLCVACRIPLPEPPAAPACERCGRVHVAHHSAWPMVLKWWLLAELARSLFLPWLADQEVWENLLCDSLNGVRVGKGPNPNGVHITMSTPAADLYPIALERAAEWKAAGSYLGRVKSALTRSA